MLNRASPSSILPVLLAALLDHASPLKQQRICLLIRLYIASKQSPHPPSRDLPTRGSPVVFGELLSYGKHGSAIHGPVWCPACCGLGQQLNEKEDMYADERKK
jgi:hypothetical protein